MSLINDALKRAKQSQQENPPSTPPLEFRAAEAPPHRGGRTTLLMVGLAVVIFAIVGLSGLLVWYVTQSKSESLPVAARIADAPIAPLETAIPTVPSLTPAPEPIPAYIERPDEPNTNGVPVAVIEPTVPPAVKLQGIFFNPQNPSAVVNGKTLYLGDRVSGFRVMGISPVAVTLVSASETNVLSLSE